MNVIVGTGLIPAHAGKTCARKATPRGSRAHPRSRGENSGGRYCPTGRPGSSPLTRGKPRRKRWRRRSERLIPAHAGKTLASAIVHARMAAHPRSRGENQRRAPASSFTAGSSPLTRGKRVWPSAGWKDRGLIPAHAGKTCGRRDARWDRWAHPRSRGENCSMCPGPSRSRGSSPLTRGKLTRPSRMPVMEGLIPAHAGKTHGLRAASGGPRAHPRSRGENVEFSSVSQVIVGSSPLTRGKQGLRLALGGEGGLIPAHAGKTMEEDT